MSPASTIQQLLSTQTRNWVVTGAAGFIGSNLVETLLKRENWPYEEISVTFQPLRLPPEAVVPPPVEGS